MATLHDAAHNGDLPSLKALLVSGVPVDMLGETACCDKGSTALHIAAEMGHSECVKYLLSAGAPHETANMWGHSAMHMAAQEGDINILQMLIAADLDKTVMHMTDEIDRTPLHLAAQAGHVPCVTALIKAGAKIDPKQFLSDVEDYSPQTSAVHTAAAAGQAACLQALLTEIGVAGTALLDTFDRSPLHLACEHAHYDCVQVLINAGADSNATCAWGSGPLHLAVRTSDLPVINALIGAGACVDTPAAYHSPLHLAALQGSLPTVRALLAAGARVNVINTCGQTPLCSAAANDHAHIVQELLEAGASLKSLDALWENRWTAGVERAASTFVCQRSMTILSCMCSTVRSEREMPVLPVLGVDVQELILSAYFDVRVQFLRFLLHVEAGGFQT